jgi:hypothetical protein
MRRSGVMWTTLAVLTAAVLLLVGCDAGSDPVLSGPGENCTKTADCESGLKCVNLVCQQAGADECPADKDCSGLGCGPDPVCGESCGSCDSDETCQSGQCVDQGSEDIYSPPTEGTWTDPTSGLTWQVTPPSDNYEWHEAKSYCDSLSLGGHSDWHLPTIGELRTLIRGCPATEDGGSCNIEEGDCLEWLCRDGSCGGGGCDSGEGPGEGGMYWPDEIEGKCCTYWSSTPVEDDDIYAWFVGFSLGSVGFDSIVAATFGMRVRCVR